MKRITRYATGAILASLAIEGILCDDTRYNILSLESGQYAGLMTAKFVDHMEQRAFMHAKKCNAEIAKRETQRVSIHEMFDMVAGSETGAIIASSLVVKKKDGTHNSAQAAVDFFKKHVDVLYRDAGFTQGWQNFLMAIIMIFGCYYSYKTAEGFFLDQDHEDILEHLKDFNQNVQRYIVSHSCRQSKKKNKAIQEIFSPKRGIKDTSLKKQHSIDGDCSNFLDDIDDNKDMLKIYLQRVPHPNKVHVWYLKINDAFYEGSNNPDEKVSKLNLMLDDITSAHQYYR